MDFPLDILKIIVCPQCGQDLRYTREQVLFCLRCRLCFPVENGLPDLTLENATPLSSDGKPTQISDSDKQAFFTVTEGPSAGLHFRLSLGTCKAIGRRLDDSIKTQVFNIDFTMTLDEPTKKLVSNYLAKTTGKNKKNKLFEGDMGSYKRLPDLVLEDTGISRLHAMLFYDETGVGILDLVSKNGTFVNGREIETSLLSPGDTIVLGSTKMSWGFKKEMR